MSTIESRSAQRAEQLLDMAPRVRQQGAIPPQLLSERGEGGERALERHGVAHRHRPEVIQHDLNSRSRAMRTHDLRLTPAGHVIAMREGSQETCSTVNYDPAAAAASTRFSRRRTSRASGSSPLFPASRSCATGSRATTTLQPGASPA